jgi:cyclopropane-fatty-acyl-phospholipid synthase
MKRNRAQPLGLPSSDNTATRTPSEDGQLNSNSGGGGMVWLLRRLLTEAGNPPVSIALWDGREVHPEGCKSLFRLFIADRGAMIKLLINPDLQFGELYTTGRLQVEGDLIHVMEMINTSLPDYSQRGWLNWLLSQIYLIKRNTLARARDNIHHHYDLGNDFYRLWLDERMVYTCAYFPRADMTLEQAQIAKLDHVCRKLWLQPGERVVEAGCGWGSLALHMARHYGVTVKAFNISREQLAYARERARAEGLDDRVEFIEDDYREIQGRYDAFVSVGMLEHVGRRHYPELGAVIDRVLAPHGRGLIHSIGRNRPQPMNAWIERRIFPGAYPPSPAELATIFEPWRFSVLDLENLRLHYAETLRHWLDRFDQQVDRVREQFGDSFVRAWRLYLAGSTAAFSTGELQLFQIVFTRHQLNEIPMSRDHLYARD